MKILSQKYHKVNYHRSKTEPTGKFSSTTMNHKKQAWKMQMFHTCRAISYQLTNFSVGESKPRFRKRRKRLTASVDFWYVSYLGNKIKPNLIPLRSSKNPPKLESNRDTDKCTKCSTGYRYRVEGYSRCARWPLRLVWWKFQGNCKVLFAMGE